MKTKNNANKNIVLISVAFCCERKSRLLCMVNGLISLFLVFDAASDGDGLRLFYRLAR